METFEDFQEPDICRICNQAGGLERDQLMQTDDIHAHFFCLLFSSGLGQKGKENEGIKGFLAADIRKELKRGARLKCVHCRKKGATVGCAEQKCKKSYHLPCGSRQDSLQQYFDQFKSYCREHRPAQKVVRTGNKRGDKKENICVICQQKLLRKTNMKTLWGPCCEEFFHRECIQELACSQGSYHFRCPTCNDTERFTMAMKMMGIYVPERDASWENGQHFAEVDEVTLKICHAKICFCPHEEGRTYHKEDDLWEVLLCKTCGSKGIHAKCGGLEDFPEAVWQCYGCRKIAKAEKPLNVPYTGLSMQENGKGGRSSKERNQNRLFEALLSALPHIQSMEDSLIKGESEKQYNLTITPVAASNKKPPPSSFHSTQIQIPSSFNFVSQQQPPASPHVQTTTPPSTSGSLQVPLPSSTEVPRGTSSSLVHTPHEPAAHLLSHSTTSSSVTRHLSGLTPYPPSISTSHHSPSRRPSANALCTPQLVPAMVEGLTFSTPTFVSSSSQGAPLTLNGDAQPTVHNGKVNGTVVKNGVKTTNRMSVSKSKANIKELYDYTLEDIIRSRLADGSDEGITQFRLHHETASPTTTAAAVSINGFGGGGGKVSCGSASSLYSKSASNPSKQVFRLVSGGGAAVEHAGGGAPQRKMTEYFLNRKH